jgi:protein-S-isoprenylcysteine O-methyltransferase Ste14
MFKASALEFRLRYWLHGIVFGLGFWAPWNQWLPVSSVGANAHTWGILAANLFQAGWLGMDAAFNALLVAAIVFALAGASLRTWGGAYLGADVVQDGAMHTTVSPTPFAGGPVKGVLTDGPFRHLRNPLYLGTFLHTFALALLMSRSGAVFTIFFIGLMQVRLILGEEAFLTRTVGQPYEAYCKLVPRLWPSLRPRIAAGGRAPRWGQAFLGEAYMWIVALAFCFAGWRYNAQLLLRCVLVAFGVSIVIKALTRKTPAQG